MKGLKSRLLIHGIMVAFITIVICGHLIAAENEQVIQITAKRFEYSPKEITLKKGVPVVLEFTSLDRLHGFDCPGLKLRLDIRPGKVNTLRFTPDKAGTFPFHCDNFCGSGHEGMRGTIIVTE
jgi:cytochrome c oxidase subunit 2